MFPPVLSPLAPALGGSGEKERKGVCVCVLTVDCGGSSLHVSVFLGGLD